MAVLKLQLLGGFKATADSGEDIAIPARKSRALLAILALSPQGGVGRERLATLLWSDRGEDQARSSLRQTLTTLRKELAAAGPNVLAADDQRVELASNTVETDAVLLANLSLTTDAPSLRRAVDLYQGELLAETSVNDPAFEEWLGSERRRLRDVMISIFDRLLPLEPAVAQVPLAKRLLALDPLREASHLSLMKAYADSGERSMALQHYAQCRDLLKSELNVQPGPDIEQLRQHLMTDGQSNLQNAQPVSLNSAKAIPDSSAREMPSIAVLPFTNIGGDPNQQYLSDGITEDIIIQLSRFREMQVRTRFSTFKISGEVGDSSNVGALLDVKYLVKGTTRISGNRMMISCQLMEVSTGNLIWSERYDRTTADIFQVQDEVVARIVTALGGRVINADASSIRKKPTKNWSAYEFFLKGREICNRAEEAASVEFFAKAVELDPEFGLAHAWWAIGLVGNFWNHGKIEYLNRAMEQADKALELGPDEATAHHAAGMALTYQKKLDRSAHHLRRAIELNPLEINIRGDYANLLLHLGRYADALLTIEEALNRDPYPPAWLYYIHGKILFFARRFDEAITALENCRVYNHRTYFLLAAAYAMLGNPDEAGRYVVLAHQTLPGITFTHFVATLPFADPAEVDFLRAALRKAGFDD